jgi:hypothetical protein
MASTWQKRIEDARRDLDQANQQAGQARQALHTAANKAWQDGARATDIARWAHVTTQALHLWRKEEQCEDSQ